MTRTQRLMFSLVVLVSAGCAPMPANRQPAELRSISTPKPYATQSLAVVDPGREVVMHALALLQSKYKYGGKTLETGLDCSGFVSHVYDSALGMSVEGSAAHMAAQGRRIARKELKAGDLVFFNTLGRPRSHVGIYIGAGKFVHAANARAGVRINRMSDRYYAARFEEARTLLR